MSSRKPRHDLARKTFLLIFTRERVLADALPFQDPIDEICEQPAPAFLRSTHYLVVGLFMALLLAGALTKVDVVVVAPGRIATVSPPIILQPMERAIIRQMNVHPGDAVTKGEVLATLDPTFADAEAGSLEKQRRALEAQIRRLEAEADGRPFAAGAAPDDDDMLQATLFRQRQAEYAARLHVFDEDIQRLSSTLRTVNDERSSLSRELEVAKAVEQMRATLLQLQSGSKLNLLAAQAGRMHTERDQQDAANRLVELMHGMESRQAERQAFIDEWRRELLEALVRARTDMTHVAAGLAKAERLQDLVVVTAPVDGVILEVAQRTAGSVLREAEPLVTLIPRDAKMIAEVTIASREVGDALPGSSVQIKIDAFPYQKYGFLPGRLISVGEESFVAGTSSAGEGGAVHPGRIELLDDKLIGVPPGSHLFPGMTLSAEIKSGSRSVLSYFLNPLTRGLHESIREP